MIYTTLTNKAMKLAYDAHHGQVDHGEVPYIFHPFHLAEQMNDEIAVCVALLHDVVEDTAITLEDLQKEFPPEITEPIRLLTHIDTVGYFDYVRAIKQSEIATRVKLADLDHNSDESRLSDASIPISQKDIDYYRGKYKKAKEILGTKDLTDTCDGKYL